MAFSAVLDPAADNPLLGDPCDSGGTVAVLGVILPPAGLSMLNAGGLETWPSPGNTQKRRQSQTVPNFLKDDCGYTTRKHTHSQRMVIATLQPPGSSNSSNWILMSCQPHRVTSGQSNSGHKQIHISKLFSHIHQPSVKSIYKTNHFTNTKLIYTNINTNF